MSWYHPLNLQIVYQPNTTVGPNVHLVYVHQIMVLKSVRVRTTLPQQSVFPPPNCSDITVCLPESKVTWVWCHIVIIQLTTIECKQESLLIFTVDYCQQGR